MLIVGAARQLGHALDLDPNMARALIALSRVDEARQDWHAAIGSAERALALTGNDLVVQSHLARLRTLSGNPADGRQKLKELEALNRTGKAHLAPQYLAYLHSALGEPGPALALLERAVAERDPNILWLNVDPRLDPYRDAPQFQELVRRVGLTP
jgi:tetratricopeptide (TPR) repeat protein